MNYRDKIRMKNSYPIVHEDFISLFYFYFGFVFYCCQAVVKKKSERQSE
jgi:hypothetical protein